MADDSMAALDSVRKAIEDGDGDFLREAVHLLAQGVMEAEVTELTGVPKGERAPDRRLTSRNGYRERRWDTRAGTIELSIPRVRDGSYFPSLLEPRRRAERALLAVVQEAYVWGSRPAVSTISCRASGSPASAAAKSAGSAPRSTPRSRPSAIDHSSRPIPTSSSTRRISRSGGRSGRVDGGSRRDRRGDVRRAPDPRAGALFGQRRGSAPGLPSSARSWAAASTASASSSATITQGLVKAIREQLLGSGWQRCRVHFSRNAQDLVPRSARSMIASAVRAIFEQPDEAAAHEQLGHITEACRPASRPSPGCCSMPRRICWPTSPSPRPTVARSAAPIHSSGSTRRSSAGPRSWASSRAEPASSVWSG